MLLAMIGCTTKEKIDYTTMPRKLGRVADSLAHAYIITDSHVDLPYRLKVRNFRLKVPAYPSAQKGDLIMNVQKRLDAPFMCICIPSKTNQSLIWEKALADALIDIIVDAEFTTKFARNAR